MARITIEKLAEMMQRSFEYLEKKFDARIDALEKKMDKGFAEVGKRSDTLEKIANNHEQRLTNTEDDVRVLKTAGR